MMKYRFLFLLTAFAPALFGQQIMTVSVDQDNFIVCPDDIVQVSASRSTTLNNSLDFNGSSEFLEIPNNPAFNIGTTSFSIEFWVLTNDMSNLEYLAVNRNSSSIGWAIWKNGSGTVGFAARDQLGNYDSMFGTISQIDDGGWHHIAVTWNRGGVTTLYIDGGYETQKTLNVGGDISHTGDITLGYGVSPTTGNATYLNGEIDEFRIWSEARSSGDIATYMSTHLNPSSFPTLAVNFDFNELSNADDWYDCAGGISAPTGTSVPSVKQAGGPSMTFNFAYTWTNTSGNTQNGANYQKSFLKEDTVVVEAGYCKYLCTDTFYVEIADCDTVKDPRDVAAVFAPTAFTPNGDTKNDYYIVKANAISYFEMQVYNREGNILFHSKDINTGWDGSFEDRQCTEGVYIAQIMYRDNEGMEHVKYQQFSLMR
ncbi:MAG TPA: hypothetical protein DCG83_03400 [Cryomorphaceae bacterium]|nr:hypothetical protein [Cryomorphaceae bacterium]